MNNNVSLYLIYRYCFDFIIINSFRYSAHVVHLFVQYRHCIDYTISLKFVPGNWFPREFWLGIWKDEDAKVNLKRRDSIVIQRNGNLKSDL